MQYVESAKPSRNLKRGSISTELQRDSGASLIGSVHA